MASDTHDRRLMKLFVEHIDGARLPFDPTPHSWRRCAQRKMVTRGFLRFVGTPECVCTELTEKGRGALSDLLADCADVLEAAGYGDPAHDKADAVPKVLYDAWHTQQGTPQ